MFIFLKDLLISSATVIVRTRGTIWLNTFATAGSQVLTLLVLFLCMIVHTMWSGKILQLLCILLFGILCLSAIRIMFVIIPLVVCMLVGIVV